MKYAIHAGHGVKGKGTVGAVGFLDESTEAREIVTRVKRYLEAEGHAVVDCTEDSGTANQILSSIVKKTNASKADISVSIHFNAGAKKDSDGKTTGVEVFVYSSASSLVPVARHITEKVALLGYKNRGVKYNSSLYVLKKTTMPSMLVECCFVDDPDDAKLYNRDTMAKAISEGILNKKLDILEPSLAPKPNQLGEFRVRVVSSSLNVRNKPSTLGKVVTTVKKGEVYTIIDMNGNWGKLKSGAGWINLKHTERI